jgi:hypothetical protein
MAHGEYRNGDSALFESMNMNRTEAAIRIRDHALSILRQHGQYEPVGNIRALSWKGERFSLLHITPFQRVEGWMPSDRAKYAVALHGGKAPETLPYRLDIWNGKKVASLEWADDGRAHIISFKRGAWEAEFLGSFSSGM